MRINKSLLILAVLFLLGGFGPSFSQQSWSRTYPGATHEGSCVVQQTSDGGYIFAGYKTYDPYDVYLIKTNALGDTLWTRTYRGMNGNDGFSIQKTTDGGYIIAGTVHNYVEKVCKVYLIKTNGRGDTLWTKTYGGKTGYSFGYSVQQTSDGGFIVTGCTTSFGEGGFDVYLIKTNASGDTIWTRTYGRGKDDSGDAVCQTSDGGYVVAGDTYPVGTDVANVYLIKTNTKGDTIWTRTYGGKSFCLGRSVQQTSDGGYFITGVTNFGPAIENIYLIKTNSSGDTLWTKAYGRKSMNRDGFGQQTLDGGYIIVGYNVTYDPTNFKVYLIKTNTFGDTLWTKTYGGKGMWAGYFVQQTSDGGYIVAGGTSAGKGKILLIKTDQDGNVGKEKVR